MNHMALGLTAARDEGGKRSRGRATERDVKERKKKEADKEEII